jgi:tetratricopeptide (TPR) repeat protein
MAASVTIRILSLGIALLWQAPAQPPAPDWRSAAAEIKAGEYSKAHAILTSSLTQTPNDPRLWTLDGLALARSKQPREALQAYNRALELAPRYLPALEGAAELEFHSRSPRAASLLNQVLQIEPRNETSHAMLATLAYEKGDCASAEAEFSQSQSAIASQPSAWEQRGVCLIKLEKLSEAVEVFKHLAALDPANPRSRYNLALSQSMAGRYQDCIATLSSLPPGQLDPDSLDLLSEAYEHLSDTPNAVAVLREAIVANPGSARLYLRFADFCLTHASFQIGVDMLSAGLTRLPDAASLYLARGILQIQLGRYESAESDFDQAERLDPSTRYAAALQGMAKLQQNNLSEAASTIEQRIAQHPQDSFLHYLLAETLARKGAAPGSPEFSRAVQAAQTAVKLQPDFGLARDVLGRLYLQDGRTEAAVKESRLAYRDDPTDQTALYHLILALKKSGQVAQVPALTKELTSLRERARTEEIKQRRFAIVQAPK